MHQIIIIIFILSLLSLNRGQICFGVYLFTMVACNNPRHSNFHQLVAGELQLQDCKVLYAKTFLDNTRARELES